MFKGGFCHLPFSSEARSHAQINAQIRVSDVQQQVSVHLQLLHNKAVRIMSDTLLTDQLLN